MCIYRPVIYLRLKPQDQEAKVNIIKKVPVTAEYGFTLLDNIVASHDWIDVGKRLFKTLDFRVSDAYGKSIDLRGMPIS